MNIWGLLFIIVFLLWLFTEYLRYIKYKLTEIAKEYKELKEAQNELENEAITILKKAYEGKWDEEFEDEIIIGDFGTGSGEINIEGLTGCYENKRTLHQLLQKYFVYFTDEEMEKRLYLDDYSQKIKIKARKGKIIIERIEA